MADIINSMNAYKNNNAINNVFIFLDKDNYLTNKVLLMLYHSYIYPYMTYCIEVWCCASETQLNCLFLL